MLDALRNIRILQFCDISSTEKKSIESKIDRLFKENDPKLYGDILTQIAPIPLSISLSSIKDHSRIGCSYSDVLNGFHVVRSYLAHVADLKRKQKLSDFSFEKNGYLIIHDFYKKRDNLVEELEKYPLSTAKPYADVITIEGTPEVKEFLYNPELYKIISACLGFDDEESRTLFRENTFVQKIHNKKGDGDVQKTFHQDTFFPALKFWYFPDEVTLESGPFEFAPSSHIFDMRRAIHTLHSSVNIIQKRHSFPKDHSEGSLRISDYDLKKLGYTSKKITLPANTLLIANVFGFHRRAEVETEGFRTSIHGSIRTNIPFK